MQDLWPTLTVAPAGSVSMVNAGAAPPDRNARIPINIAANARAQPAAAAAIVREGDGPVCGNAAWSCSGLGEGAGIAASRARGATGTSSVTACATEVAR